MSEFTLRLGDSVVLLEQEREESVNLIFADPPYNLQLPGTVVERPDGTILKGVTEEWDKFSSLSAYKKFTEDWLKGAHRVLHPDGSLVVMGSYHCIYTIGYTLMELGWWVINDISWIKANPTPQFRGVRLCNAHETLIWATKSKKAKYTFNYHQMKEGNNGKQLRSDWYFPICGGKERLRDEDGKKLHPTQKPLKLTNRIVKMLTNPGDVVLDPFCGAGTSGVSALNYGCKYIGYDFDAGYLRIAKDRLESMAD